VTVCVYENAADCNSLTVKKHDGSVFLQFGDIAPYIAPGSLVVDVGAHAGLASLYFLARGHPVISFEPSSENVRLLRAAQSANTFDRWTIEARAVSDSSGSATFFADGPWGHLAGGESTTRGLRETVETISLDDWFSAQPKRRIGLLKVDVEGGELGVLRGAEQLLGRDDAPALLIESNGHALGWFGGTPTDLRRAIARFGYRIFGVRPKRVLRRTAFYPVDTESLQARCVVDYFCVKDMQFMKRRRAHFIERPPSRSQIVQDAASTMRGVEDERRYLKRILGDYPEIAALPEIQALVEDR